MIFFRNELYKFVELNQVRRILWISPSADAIVSIQVDAKVNAPEWAKRTDWEALAAVGKIEPVAEDLFLRLPAESQLGVKARERRDTAWSHISALVADEPNVYLADTRAAMVRALSAESCVHKDTIRNWFFAYWQRGMTRNALLPDWDKCGNRGQRKADTEKKRGRPRSVTLGVGVNVGAALQKIFEVAIKNYYLRNKKATLAAAFRQMLRKHFSEYVEDDSQRELILREEGKLPTYDSFYYWYRVGRNEESEVKARKGKRFFERTLRPLLGNSTHEAIGPGFRYQIDATIADVYLVSKVNPNDIIGRPVVYVVIDVWSRMIVGIYVGLEHASWTAAMMALLNAASDKVAFCNEYRIPISPEEWPAAGLSTVILGDRGELESALAERMSNVLGITVENTPPYRPDWKGIVERMFGLLPAKFKHFLPGYIDVDYRQRGAEDYRLDAALTLYEFTRIMILSALDHNATTIGEYPLSPEMIRDGVLPIPNELWAWGIKKRAGMLKSYDRKLLQFALMHTEEATVTESGIKFYNRHYASRQGHEAGWYTKARGSGAWKVSVSYDTRCLDEILLHDPHDTRRFEVCRLISDDEEQFGLCLQELLAMQRRAKGNKAERAHRVLEKSLGRDAQMEKIALDAIERKASLGPDERSKAERTGDIRKNAATERKVQREFEKLTFSSSETSVVELGDGAAEMAKSEKKTFAIPSIFDIRKKQR
ncbi:Mu transposase C-terminal domain-containing protein [Paraburkholderia humisilvae]|uniref:Transposon Tn7 transposition protein TnsB n=1 Tax=Paraburkholderia humisilvae TaxID=627669 RepID=A0A6J5DPG1_9BURK|nr:Mu transposase C-terminal domain-containing protein [Paraburkholderia humisilvae]CAB3755404.1 Transposon Tn7 transposition protein TnsB [Paraburkholderia humisilvae]